MEITLEELSELFNVHPRTILRGIHNDEKASYPPGFNPTYDVDEIALIFDCEDHYIKDAIKGKDELFNQAQAAEFLSITVRALRYRNYDPVIRRRGIVRYSRHKIANETIERFG